MSDASHHRSPQTLTAPETGSVGSLSPEALADLLPSRALLNSPQVGWRGIKLQMFRHPPGAVSSPGNRDHVLVLNIAGKALIDDTTDGRRRQGWADAGHFSLTPAGTPSFRSWKGRPEVLLVYLNPSLVRNVAKDLDIDPTGVDVVPRVAVPDPLLHSFGHLLRSEAANPLWGSALMVDSIVRAVAVHLLRHQSNLAATTPPPRQTLTSRRLNRVVDYMRAHLSRSIALSELAGVCGLSPTHFSRAFREAAGKPPHAYLIDLRLERAVDLLEHTRLSVTEIALSCGFDQPQYFATIFRRKLGFAPSLWRTERGL